MIDDSIMIAKAELHGIKLEKSQLEQLNSYANMLVEWNSKMNLTAITDRDGIMTKHFEDSLTLLHFVDFPLGSNLIDVGTGAGFPGMVLKILRADLNVTLLDSLNKRISFLTAVADYIGVSVNPVHLRAEEGGRMASYREKFDFACARAVSNLRELSEYCLPFVRVGGQFLSMKGPDASDEIEAARAGVGTLGGKIRSVLNYNLSDESGRSLIIVDKVRSTPSQFPRQSAKIKKKPL